MSVHTALRIDLFFPLFQRNHEAIIAPGVILQSETALTALGLFCFMAGLVVLAFFAHQLSLVLRGKTTNETFKWDDVAYAIKKREISGWHPELADYNATYSPRTHRKKEVEFQPTPKKKPSSKKATKKEKQDSATVKEGLGPQTGAENLRKRDGKTHEPTPTSTDTDSNINKMATLTTDSPEESELLPLTSVKQIKNIYDRGMWGNLMEVLFPESFD
ncbi:hypothetical protein HK102_000961 [Quaeritorhiza haematococci]|nr:hypothetical protein HK102_000961 [Quaeritorhiza haematococci]